MTSIEKEAFWLGVIHVDLWKVKGISGKGTIFTTSQIRISGKCFNFRDARKYYTVKFEFVILQKLKSFLRDRFM